jgi:Protein of unknown function (DUF1064)
MPLWRGAGVAFCVTCNADRPSIKADKRQVCVACRSDVKPPRTKYGNVPTRSRHTDRTFHSKKEANREPVLLALQNTGEIHDLKYQQSFRLELYGTEAVNALLAYLYELEAERGFAWSPGMKKLIEDVCRSRQAVGRYVADFTYTTKDGQPVVEDVKGYVTPVYAMKKKLMSLAHNVDIVEPGEGGVQQRARGAGVHGRGTGSRLMGGRG